MYIATWRLKIQGRSDDREWNQARSKTDTVDRPVRTAHTFVHHYNRTQYCSTESFISSPLPPDQYQVQVWSSWDGGDEHVKMYKPLWPYIVAMGSTLKSGQATQEHHFQQRRRQCLVARQRAAWTEWSREVLLRPVLTIQYLSYICMARA